MVLAKQNILNAKREKRTFCARLLHPQTRLMHPDRTHPSTMIQAYSSNTLKSLSLRTQLASPPYNDKCGARTHDQLSTEKRPLPRLEPMNTLAHRVTVIHWALTVGWPQTPSSPIRSQSRGVAICGRSAHRWPGVGHMASCFQTVLSIGYGLGCLEFEANPLLMLSGWQWHDALNVFIGSKRGRGGFFVDNWSGVLAPHLSL